MKKKIAALITLSLLSGLFLNYNILFSKAQTNVPIVSFVHEQNEIPKIVVRFTSVFIDDSSFFNDQSDLREWRLYKNPEGTGVTVGVGDLGYNAGGDYWYANISCKDYVESIYAVKVHFHNGTDAFVSDYSESIKIEHYIKTSFLIQGPDSLQRDVLKINNIEAFSTYKYSTIPITKDTATVARWRIVQGSTSNILRQGDLFWNETASKWDIGEIGLAFLGIGDFWVALEFKTEELDESEITATFDASLHMFSRYNVMEIVILLVIILGAILGAIIAIAIIYMKKSTASLERKHKKEKKKDIKIKEITKQDLKEAKERKTEKKPKEKKEKGKTEASKDLIFSVPTWEDEDLEGNSEDEE